MFYSHFILARKGPLGTIWIAAHLEGKLRKNQVTETNISASVDSILFPDVPIALRLSGHLLLGVVRIYSRKVHYLYHDCSEALVKIKHAFHFSSVDLPPEASKVPFHSITLPETFDFDELEASFKWDKVHTLSGESADHHVSARDLITLQEQTQEPSHGSLFDPDERFPGGSDPYSLLYESSEEHGHKPLSASNPTVSLQQEIGVSALEEDVFPPLPVDDEMELEREEAIQMDEGAPSPIHSSMYAFLDIPCSSPTVTKENRESSLFPTISMQDIPEIEKLRAAPEQKEPEPFLMELEEEHVPSSNTLKIPGVNERGLHELDFLDVEFTPVINETPLSRGPSPVTAGEYDKYTGNEDLLGEILGGRTPAFKAASSSGVVQESAQQKRKRRKRKAILDDKPVLSNMAMKKQLAGAAGLIRQRRKLPLTEFGVQRMQDTYEEQRFGMPSFPRLDAPIRDLYSRFMGLPSKEQSSSSPINDRVNSQVHKDGDRVPDTQFSVADNAPLDTAESPLHSHHSSPQYAPHIPNNNAEEIGMAMQEPQNLNIGGAIEGHQENCAADFEVGQELQDVAENLPNVNYLSALFQRGDDMLQRPEALATQASSNEVNNVSPIFSPSLTCTPSQALNVSAHGIPKLDFLDTSRDNALFPADSGPQDPFIDEMDTNSYRKERPHQNSYGWSVRTKFVAKYLKSVFEELEGTVAGGSQPVQVSLDSLLKGRPRKEAARLYFEILVLKSRDYIDVEQKTGFAEIMLSSTDLVRKDIL